MTQKQAQHQNATAQLLNALAFEGAFDEAACLALIENGADIHATDDNGDTLLVLVLERAHMKQADFLIDQGEDVNASRLYDKTPALHLAVYNDISGDTVRKILEKSANLNVRDEDGDTALMAAISVNASIEIINVLLEHGAALDIEKKGGDTARTMAAYEGRDDVIEAINVEEKRRTAAAFRAAAEQGTTRTRRIRRFGKGHGMQS